MMHLLLESDLGNRYAGIESVDFTGSGELGAELAESYSWICGKPRNPKFPSLGNTTSRFQMNPQAGLVALVFAGISLALEQL